MGRIARPAFSKNRSKAFIFVVILATLLCSAAIFIFILSPILRYHNSHPITVDSQLIQTIKDDVYDGTERISQAIDPVFSADNPAPAIAAWQQYIDATTDNTIKARLYFARADYLISHNQKALCHSQILPDAANADRLLQNTDSAAEALNIAIFCTDQTTEDHYSQLHNQRSAADPNLTEEQDETFDEN